MNQEYYFLYREGENPVGMPSNIKLISYGNEYSDLPDFLEDMAELRIKEKVIKRTADWTIAIQNSGICDRCVAEVSLFFTTIAFLRAYQRNEPIAKFS